MKNKMLPVLLALCLGVSGCAAGTEQSPVKENGTSENQDVINQPEQGGESAQEATESNQAEIKDEEVKVENEGEANSEPEQVVPEENGNEEAKKQVNTKPLAIMISSNYDGRWDNSDDYITIAQAKAQGFSVMEDGYSELKSALAKEAKQNMDQMEWFLSSIDNLLAENEGIVAEECATMPWTFEDSITIDRNDGTLFAFTVLESSYMGGAHPGYGYSSSVYEVATGKKLELRDVVKDYDAFYQFIMDELNDYEYKDGFFETWEDSVKQSFYGEGSMQWTLTDSGMTLLFQTYDLGPYVMGPVMVNLDEAQCKEQLKNEYMPTQVKMCRKVGAYEQLVMDFNHDGKEEMVTVEPIERHDDENYIDDMYINVNYGQDESSLSTQVIDYCLEFYGAYVMEGNDGKTYLYVEVGMENDWHSTYIYDLSEPNLGPVSLDYNVAGSFYEFAPTNPEHMFISSRAHCFGTHSGYRVCHVGKQGQLEYDDEFFRIPEYSYEDPFGLQSNGEISRKPADWDVVALQDIQAFVYEPAKQGENRTVKQGLSKETTTIKAGDKLLPYYMNGEDIMVFKTEDGKFVYLQYDAGYQENWEHPINGIPELELFDGIFYAG